MAWPPFQAHVPGKWVLTGEHSVLRGQTAVALPLPLHERSLFLQFRPHSQGGLSVHPPESEKLFGELLKAGMDSGRELPQGSLSVQSSIPIGAGLGSSAALCVAFARWVRSPGDADATGLATELEHRFHGRSSGMDVAVIAANRPVKFTRAGGAVPLEIRKLPRFTFHDTGLRCGTSVCVEKVERFRRDFTTRAEILDRQMGAASALAVEGLLGYDAYSHSGSTEGLAQISEAMRQAQDCFSAWDLIPGEARRLEEELRQQGALAVKITGAGGGGMLVALWAD